MLLLIFGISVLASALTNSTERVYAIDTLSIQDSLFTANLGSVCRKINEGDNTQNVDTCKNIVPQIYDDCRLHPDRGVEPDDPKYLSKCIAKRAHNKNNSYKYPDSELINLFKGPEGDPYDASSVACRIGDQIGWLVCPASSFLAKLADGAYNFLANFLRYDALTSEQNPSSGGSGGQPSPTTQLCNSGGGIGANNTQPIECAWSQMRNLANVVFVLMFVVIIYSQVTGFGFSNYNVKKMLPRLIVASVLVNVSYWLCALAVDISNVLGSNLYYFLGSLGKVQSSSTDVSLYQPDFGTYMTAILGGSALILFAGAALSASGALLATLSFMLPIMISALVACITIIVILIARQGIITLLIVVSPLALVMMLLPNTSRWFDRWKDLFVSMLILYPLVGVVFGGALLAGTVVRLADTGVLSVIFSMGIQSIPLFIIPGILKSTGGMLGKIGAISNNKSKGLFDRANNRAQKSIRNRQIKGATKQANKYRNNPPKTRRAKLFRRMRAGSLGRQMDKEEKQKDIAGALGQATDNYNNSVMQNYDKALQAAGGNEDIARRMQGSARQATMQHEAKTQSGLMEQMSGMEATELVNMLHNEEKYTEDQIGAALQQLIKIGDPHKLDGDGNDLGYAQFVDKFQAQAQASGAHKTGGTAATRATARALQGSAYLGGAQVSSIASGNAQGSFADMVHSNIAGGGLSAEKLAKANSGELGYIEHLGNNGASDKFRQNVKDTANKVLNTPEIRSTVGKAATPISRMSSW